jgi:hypothetical protein
MTFTATYIPWFITFIAETSRKGSRKIVYSAMPADKGLDVRVSPRDVPLEIRRAAKAALI